MAKGDHDTALSTINNTRNTMQPQYQQNANMFGQQYGAQYNKGNNMMNQQWGNIMNWRPSYSFAGGQGSYGNSGGNSGWWNANGGGINGNAPGNNIYRPMGTISSGSGYQTNSSGRAAAAGVGEQGSNSSKMLDLAKQARAQGLSGQQAVDWVNAQAPGSAQYAQAGGQWDPNKLVWYDKGGGYGKFQYAGDDGNWEYKSEGGGPDYVNELGGGTAAYGTGGDSGTPQIDLSFLDSYDNNVRPYFQKFADTGGYSDQDLADLRARGISPTRSIYANAQDQMARQLALSNNQSGANYNASSALMNRQLANQIGEQNQNVNAGIAQMVNSGKQFGTSGLSNLDLARMQAQLSGKGMNLGALMQQRGYQTQEEIARNNNELQAMGLGNQALGLQNQMTGQQLQGLLENQGQYGNFMLGSDRNMLGGMQVPSDFQQGMGNLGSIFGLAGNIGGLLGKVPWGKLGSLFGMGSSSPYYGSGGGGYDDNSMEGYV